MATEISLKFNKKDLKNIKKFPKKFSVGLLKGLRDGMFFAEAAAKKSFGKTGKLQVGTGRLRSSIKSGVKQRIDSLIGYIGSNIIYAKIHEFGGIIRARAAKFLKFQVEGKWIIASQVTIPAKPYLEPAIKNNIAQIKDLIGTSILREVRK